MMSISVDISFPTDDELSVEIISINLELQPGFWNLKDIHDNIKGRKVIIKYSYLDNKKLISNSKTYHI